MKPKRYRDTQESQETQGTEIQRNGAKDVIDDKDVVPPLATRVRSLQEAAHLSLESGINEQTLFIYGRALRAFELTTDFRLKPSELPNAFNVWWNMAKDKLPPEADYDEYRFDFEHTFKNVKFPLGANHLKQAILLAKSEPLPPEASRYPSPKLQRLVAVCFHLQQFEGTAPFFISVRDAADILETGSLHRASAMLNGLVTHGILKLVTKGIQGGNKASRFRYVGSSTKQS